MLIQRWMFEKQDNLPKLARGHRMIGHILKNGATFICELLN